MQIVNIRQIFSYMQIMCDWFIINLIKICRRMDRAWIYDLARIDPMYLENVRQFVEEAKRHANRQNKNDIFCPCVDCENKIAWPDSKVVQPSLRVLMMIVSQNF
jgi:hypothetical protein